MGREFQLLEMGQVKFGWSKVKLGVSSHLVFTLQNPLARALTLDKGQHLGWATRSQEEPPARRAQPYVPSNFSYSQLGRERGLSPSPQRLVSPYQPPAPSPKYRTPSPQVPRTSPQVTRPSYQVPRIPLEPPSPRPISPTPRPPKIPLEPIKGPRTPPGAPTTPRHKRPLPGTWGAPGGDPDPLTRAHQEVVYGEDAPRPPSPTVRPERPSPPKATGKVRDPRLQAVRIERKSAMPFSKKVLEDRGIVQPQGNPKYFSPGQNFSPMLEVLPGSKLWTAENRQQLFAVGPELDRPKQHQSYRSFRQEMSHVDGKKKTEQLLMAGELGNKGKADNEVPKVVEKNEQEKAKNNEKKSLGKIVKRKKGIKSADGDSYDGKVDGEGTKKKKSKLDKKLTHLKGVEDGSKKEMSKMKKKAKNLDKGKRDEAFWRRLKEKRNKSATKPVLPVTTTSKNLSEQKPKKKLCLRESSPESSKEIQPSPDESAVLRNEDDLEDEFLKIHSNKSPPDQSQNSPSDSDSDTILSVKTWSGEHKVCPLCKEDFRSLKEYRIHYRTPHTAKCGFCKLIYNCKDKLEEHMESEHLAASQPPKKQVKNPSKQESLSETELSQEDPLKNIVSNVVAKKKVKKLVPKISKAQKAKELLDENVETASSSLVETGGGEEGSHGCQKICCNYCCAFTEVVPVVVFVDETTIDFIQDVESEDDHPCQKCKEIFPCERDLFEHNMREHQEGWTYVNEKPKKPGKDPIGPFRCNTCAETVNTWGGLVKHSWQPHLFKCTYCDFAFNRNTKLEDHSNKTHNLVGLIDITQCGLCGETFARSSSLARHVAAPHPYLCPHCEASFQTVAALKKHTQQKICSKSVAMAMINHCIESMGIV